MRPNATLQMKNCIGPEWDSNPRPAVYMTAALTNFTPYNVDSVLWRLFSTLEVVQYIGGITSVLWGIASVLWGDSFSTVEVVQYSGGIASVLWGIASVLWRWFSTVGG